MSRFTRRRFLKTAAAASAAFPIFTVAGTKASGIVVGANEIVHVGVAGVHGRGQGHISEYHKVNQSQPKDASGKRTPVVQITHLIDPDTRLYKSRGKKVEELFGKAPKCLPDIRTALDDKDLDAVSVATCNHWHSLITVWACQAGKDVYVEKPISHTVFEGRKCVEASRRYGRVVQHGTQQRSDATRRRQIAAIQSGKYGKLLVSKGYCCKPRWSIGIKPFSPPPPGFDFNIWLGPAPKQPFHGNLHPYNWHWFWDFGNGDIGNQGVHEIDVARWAIPDATLPTRVWSLGGRFIPDGKDQGQTPNMQLAVYEYGDTILLFEVRGLVAKKGAPPFKVANEFYTTEGVIRDWKFYPNGGGDPQKLELAEAPVLTGGPFGSFIKAVRAQQPASVNCDAEVAHYSAALCHLGNISYQLGKPAPFRGKPKLIGDNAQVVESFDALRDNLKAVNIKLDETTYQVGRTLEFDPASEQFPGDAEANALLTRTYRKPFIVPAKV